jgi:hypothetical protein
VDDLDTTENIYNWLCFITAMGNLGVWLHIPSNKLEEKSHCRTTRHAVNLISRICLLNYFLIDANLDSPRILMDDTKKQAFVAALSNSIR